MKNKQSTNKWVFERAKPFIPWVIFISILNVVASLAYIILAKLSQNIIDNAATDITNTFILGSALLFALILFHIIIEALVSILSTSISTKMNI